MLDKIDLNLPWIESDLFEFYLKKKPKKINKIARFFHKNGYIILDLKLKQKFINNIIKDIASLASDSKSKKNPKYYHYNENPRIIEGFKKSKLIRELCHNRVILNFLKQIYEKKPIPINSINFIKGTDQPLHSDYIHFGSLPHKYLAAAWIALEKTDEYNGTICLVPGSHKLDIIDYESFNLPLPSSTEEISKFYKIYEKYVENVVKSKKLKVKNIKLKQGQAIIWAANLLHGGKKIINKKRSRYSQVIHYHFEKCKLIYNPMFSSTSQGRFSERDLKKLEIKKHQ